MLKKTKSFVFKLDKWSCVLGNACIVINMMIVVVNVFMRSVFHRPIAGITDAVGFISCIIVVLTIAHTEALNGHIHVDFIVAYFPTFLQKIIYVIMALLNIAVVGALAACFFNYTITSMVAGTTSMTAKLPYAPFLAVCTVGMTLFALTVVVKLIDKLINWEGGRQE